MCLPPSSYGTGQTGARQAQGLPAHDLSPGHELSARHVGNCHWKVAGEQGADFTCPCPGHCERWPIRQKPTACRSHLQSRAAHVCRRTKWGYKRQLLLPGKQREIQACWSRCAHRRDILRQQSTSVTSQVCYVDTAAIRAISACHPRQPR